MGLLGKLAALTIETVILPVDIVKDVVTLGGVTSDNNGTYTGHRLSQMSKTVEKAIEDLKS